MAILALDTTTVVATTAVVKQGQVLAQITLGVQRNHAERILPAVDLALREAGVKLSELKTLAVTIGPGSFTGQRIGLSLAKGLAEGLGIPLAPLSTLRLLAEQLAVYEGIAVPLLDAQRSQYYCGVYRVHRGKVEELVPEQALDHSDLPKLIARYPNEPVILTGEAAVQAAAELKLCLAPYPLRIPQAAFLGMIAEGLPGVDPQEVFPNYIRASSAKPRKGGEHHAARLE